MSGIERLRTLAGAWDELGLGGALAEIADQIERELRDERDRWESDLYEAQVAWNRVTGVCLEMERRCLYNEDTVVRDVARWARELRHATRSDTSDAADAQNPSWHDPDGAADVTSEAAKVTSEDADAARWVREHGGLDHVKAEWRSRVPYDRYVARRQRLLGHIAECETALGRRREIISKLGHRVSDLTNENAELRRRAMPEGMCWPVFEDGEPVLIGDKTDDIVVRSVVFQETGVLVTDGTSLPGWNKWRRYKEPFPCPAPKVLDADGVEICEGDALYYTPTGCKVTVRDINSDGTIELDGHENRCWRTCLFTHRAPVLAADGKPLREGETVYHTKSWMDKEPRVIERLEPLGDFTRVWFDNGNYEWSANLTHERPESKCRDCAYWQKDPTADNMGVCWLFYHEYEGQDCYAARRADIGACEEFMPRGKALAGDA